jgi:hypothetical protein
MKTAIVFLLLCCAHFEQFMPHFRRFFWYSLLLLYSQRRFRLINLMFIRTLWATKRFSFSFSIWMINFIEIFYIFRIFWCWLLLWIVFISLAGLLQSINSVRMCLKLSRGQITSHIFIICTARARKIIRFWVVLHLLMLIFLSLNLFLRIVLWLRAIVLPLFLLTLQFS